MFLEKEDNSAEGDEEALKKLLLDPTWLEQLSPWTSRFNAFDVLGITKTEIRHSNVLAWLMDPTENHGLGDGVIRGFVNHVAQFLDADRSFDDLLMDCDGFSIRREWRHIDILAVNERERYVLCIENKTFSGEHDDQLNRYRADVEKEFPDYRRRFVFLTPDSREASEPDWLPMGYGKVLDIIESAVTASTPATEQEQFISEYMDAVRSDILEDKKLEKICRGIYARHRKALDLIYRHRPDTASEILVHCKEWLEEKADSEGTIIIRGDADGKSVTMFTTKFMDRLPLERDNPSGVFGDYGHCVYQIRVDNDQDVPQVRLQLVFNFDGLDKDSKETCRKAIQAIQKTSGKRTQIGNIWCTAWTTEYSSVRVDSDEDWIKSLGKTLNGLYECLKEFEGKLSENPWVRENWPADTSDPGQEAETR